MTRTFLPATSTRSLHAGATTTALAAILLASIAPVSARAQGYNPGVTYTVPNFANSSNLRKFVDSLPGLGAPGCVVGATTGQVSCNENNLGQYIPIAKADTTTYPGSDFYQIGLKPYQMQLHSDLPPTALRGYYQLNGVDHSSQYLGPVIIAQRDRPVRFLFKNNLPLSNDGANALAPFGNLPLPVDTNIMGAGMGPLGGTEMYTQNRATVHLHGGFTPWISDGTPHQWITPAGDPTSYKKGVAFQNVPDMVGPGKSIVTPAAGDGLATFFYPNQQSARLMFYHDHAYGITRLNVYAGEAAGYLLTDPVEEDLITGANHTGNGLPAVLPDIGGAGGVYHYGIPLVIQDRTFVNDSKTQAKQAPLPAGYTPSFLTTTVDPLWSWGPGGNFWMPHEYMPNEDLNSSAGFNPMGRWDYGPWMIPPMTVQNPVLPSPTLIPEAYGDTPIVNGTAFPYVTLPPTAVRFRILNACNDRMLNLQLYYAATASGVVCDGVQLDATGKVPAQAACTEMSMVPAAPNAAYPSWPRDGRDGGVPNPVTAGPPLIQIGNEGGFLVKPAVWTSQPIDFDYNRRSVTFGGVTSHTLLLLPAFRADVIVDLAGVKPGATLMLYNDAPAPMPLFDSRNDYFTDAPDQTAAGGALPTAPGFGPNTRTIMQIRVNGTPAAAPYNLTALTNALAKAYAVDQDPPLVPQTVYNAAFPGIATTDIYAKGWDEALNVSSQPQPVSMIMTTVPGVNYLTAPKVVFSGGFPAGCVAPACTPATATATLNGVTGITLVTAGSGYTSAPAVAIGAPGAGGIQATAVATVSGGVVTTITVTNPGSNYTVAPAVTLSGGGAAAVQATAQTSIVTGSVGAITILTAGSGYVSAPLITLQGGGGTGAAAVAMLGGSLVMNGKNLVEGFDMEFGRMNAVLGSTPNPLAPTVGAGAVLGAAFYVDPPTEILPAGTVDDRVLWRLTHIGVDSHAIHFHLFNVQVVNRIDWTNTIKPPYPDELGWKETIRTNPFEDIIVAIKPAAMNLPFVLPNSNRLLDPTSVAGSTANFTPAAPPPGFPAVAGTTNVMTNFGWEYVWHCHLLGHEENDMMRPIVFQPAPPTATESPTPLAFGTFLVGTSSGPLAATMQNSSRPGAQSLDVSNVVITGANRADFSFTNGCTGGLAPLLTCPVNVTFTPRAAGTRTATLAISTNDPARPTVNVPISGTGATVPAAPSNLTATIATASSVALGWVDNSNNETGFAIWRSDNGAAFGLVGTVPRSGAATTNTGGAVTYTDGSLVTGTTYSYYVTATNAIGPSTPTATVSIALVAPAAPSNLTATIGSATTIALSWRDNSNNESSFTVWSSVGGAAFTQVGTVARGAAASANTGGTVNFTDPTAVAGNTYAYYVTASNVVGTSVPSPTVTLSFTAPAAPTGLTAAIATATSIRLTWTDASNNESAFAVWGSTNGAAFTQVGTVARGAALSAATGGSVTFTNTALTAGNTYAYYVTATNVVGASTPTATVTVVFSVPAAPSGLTVSAVTAPNGTDTVTLNWVDNSTNATTFRVRRATDAAFTLNVNNTNVAAPTTTLAVTGVARGRTFYYQVQARNSVGASAWVTATPFPITTP